MLALVVAAVAVVAVVSVVPHEEQNLPEPNFSHLGQLGVEEEEEGEEEGGDFIVEEGGEGFITEEGGVFVAVVAAMDVVVEVEDDEVSLLSLDFINACFPHCSQYRCESTTIGFELSFLPHV